MRSAAARARPGAPLQAAPAATQPLAVVALAQEAAKQQPSAPVLAADGSRCRGSKAKVVACVQACSERDEIACSSLFQACEDGEAGACGHAGLRLELGGGGGPDRTTKMLSYYEAACAGEVMIGCLRLEGLYSHGGAGVSPDPERVASFATRSFEIARAECEAGDGNGCMYLGGAYERGWGAGADAAKGAAAYARAVKLMTAACDAGVGGLCHQLGVHFTSGIGVAKDRKRGLALLQRACSLGWEQSAASCQTLQQERAAAPQVAAP